MQDGWGSIPCTVTVSKAIHISPYVVGGGLYGLRWAVVTMIWPICSAAVDRELAVEQLSRRYSCANDLVGSSNDIHAELYT